MLLYCIHIYCILIPKKKKRRKRKKNVCCKIFLLLLKQEFFAQYLYFLKDEHIFSHFDRY